MAKRIKSTKSKSSITSSKKKSSTKLKTKVLTEEVQVQVVNEEPEVHATSEEEDLKAEAIGRLKVYLNRAAESLMSIKSDAGINSILAPDQVGQLNTVREIVTGLVKSLPKN